MFEIDYSKSNELIEKETQDNFNKIEGIEEIRNIFKELFNADYISFVDDQVCGLSLEPTHKILTVYIRCNLHNKIYRGKEVKHVYCVIDFLNPEIHYFDIEPWHYIDDVVIQQNKDGKYSISFGSGELDFRYETAKVNRYWFENGGVVNFKENK